MTDRTPEDQPTTGQPTPETGQYPPADQTQQWNGEQQPYGGYPPGAGPQGPYAGQSGAGQQGAYPNQTGPQGPYAGPQGYGAGGGYAGPQGGYVGPDGQLHADGQQWGYPPKQRGRLTAIIVVISLLVVILLGLGLWWWISKSSKDGMAPGTDTPSEAVTQFVDRVNETDIVGMIRSQSPAEQEYASALANLGMRYSWQDLEEPQVDLYSAYEEYADEFAESIDLTVDLTYASEIELGEAMAAVPVTGGRLSFEVTDPELLADTLTNIVYENVPEDALTEIELPEDRGEFRDSILAELPDEPTVTEVEGGQFSFITVKEAGGWYISMPTSFATILNPDFFFDEGYRADFVATHGEAPNVADVGSESAEEAAQDMMKALSQASIPGIITQLPLAEGRPLSLLMYLASDDMDGVDSFQGLFNVAEFATHSLDISDHSALAVIDALDIRLNPALMGTEEGIIWKDGSLSLVSCQISGGPDLSNLTSDETPLMALAVIEDESGWNVSLGATTVNAAGVIGAHPELIIPLMNTFNSAQCG